MALTCLNSHSQRDEQIVGTDFKNWDRISWVSDFSRPWDFCMRSPAFQKKQLAVINLAGPAQVFSSSIVCRASTMYFISVDFPDPAFPDTPNVLLPDRSQSRNPIDS